MARSLRCTWVLLVATTLAVALGAWLMPVALTDGRDFEDLLTAGCAATACVATGWLWAVAVLAVLEAGRSGPQGTRRPAVGTRSRRGPGVVRRGVLWACGVSTVASLAVPAAHAAGPVDGRAETHAEGHPEKHAEGHRGRPTVGSVVAGVLQAGRRPAGPSARPATVTVRPGDTLWQIAAHDLMAAPRSDVRQDGQEGPRGTRVIDDAEVDRRWREIYAANRDLIGEDPDLIRPAQRLRLPQEAATTNPDLTCDTP